jgi:hypothetical protein
MEEQKQYHDELLEWCNHIYSYWSSMKPRVSNLFDLERLEEWEDSCLQLKEKLQTNLNVEFDDYLTAKSLYGQWEQLFKEPYAYQEAIVEREEETQLHQELLETNDYQEEIEVDSYNRFELEEVTQLHQELSETDDIRKDSEVDSDICLELERQTQLHGELLETNPVQEELELGTDTRRDLEKQLQYREDLLEWCNNIDSNWESRKPNFSKIFESLVEWEVSYRLLKEKLQADLKADFNDYQRLKAFMHDENS